MKRKIYQFSNPYYDNFHVTEYTFINTGNIDGDEEIEIDARTSDAIAIAIRMGCPIFTYNDILQEAGIILTDNLPNYKDENTEELEETKDILSTLSLGELKKQMKEAINDENYEKASELRDELKLTYNKARQASITNEILEIVGGAEALNS